jgi:hypothetical protein
MNVGIWNKAVQFHFWEYTNGIFDTVYTADSICHFVHISIIPECHMHVLGITRWFCLCSELRPEAPDLWDGGECDGGAGEGHHSQVPGQAPGRL